MLTEKQIAYLATIPEDRIAIIKPFNPKGLFVTQEIISQIKSVAPNLEVKSLGSLALGIAGAEDIDISIFCEKEKHAEHISNLEKVLGKYDRLVEDSAKWDFEKDGFHVDVILVDHNNKFSKRVDKVFGELRNNPELLKEYEKMKLSFNGKSYREYQTAKFEFFNKVFGAKEFKIIIENLKGTYKSFEIENDPVWKDYPLSGVTYPVDYGYIEGYQSEDGQDLDVFQGSGDLNGYIKVWRCDVPIETKIVINVTQEEWEQIIKTFNPVIKEKALFNNNELESFLTGYRNGK
ncbi:MAG TPA: hypothetical protein VI937_02545 [Negativicutes bacterium]|nr:MAG: hypothetical protein A3C50_01860 [Candidatus Staskawiczbacteria bacterium RIFCSPHIGHO2_02_FULL_43_16]OGZ74452.1 MAG: hypothetical protein A3A12_01630 [Candidatus Staskawiczbacteria bacterium RIFCSPLOWO2_01_FULL_43_17b]HLD70736.1 hypothetical protein [Negativicutes bacterium]